MSIAAKMFQLLRETPEALVAYQEDFIVHDLARLATVKLGDVLVWVVRNHGTHLWPMGCESDMARAVLENSEGIVLIRMICITRGAPVPSDMDQSYADGVMERLSKAQALELVKRKAEVTA